MVNIGQTDNSLVPVKKALNELLLIDLKVNNLFDSTFQRALATYQKKNNIIEVDKTGAYYGDITYTSLKNYMEERFITENDFIIAANVLNVELAVIKAASKVEAPKGAGFYNNKFPVILFERYVFYRQYNQKHGLAEVNIIFQQYPDICNLNSGGYVGGVGEINRFNKAKAIDEECAILATSFGLFQILGLNYKAAGFNNVHDYFTAVCKDEHEQLKCFINFIKNDNTLLHSLQTKNFSVYAEHYNGRGNVDNYSKAINDAYLIFAKK